MNKVVSIQNALKSVQYLSNRTPETTSEEAKNAFCKLADYRNGEIYLGHYAGTSEWERHSQGDEIVYVLDGETSLILLVDGNELKNILGAGELLVVPKNVWHRFESARGVKVMTVTPQPTDHSIERPGDV